VSNLPLICTIGICSKVMQNQCSKSILQPGMHLSCCVQ